MLPAAQALNRKGTSLMWFAGINQNLSFAHNLSFKFPSLAVRGIGWCPRAKSENCGVFWAGLDL